MASWRCKEKSAEPERLTVNVLKTTPRKHYKKNEDREANG